MQGIVFDKFVELDMDEVLLRKVHAISSKAGLRDVLQRDNEAQLDVGKGRVTSAQYHAQPADLRDMSQVRGQCCLALLITDRSCTLRRPRRCSSETC